MDPDSPASRVERTFWAVWYYITGAVNRFLRPEPINIVNNEQESLQGSVHSGLSESDPNGQGVSTASLLSSSRPVIVWELCTTDVDLGPEEESLQQQSQLSGGTESSREEEIDQKGNVDSGEPAHEITRAKENKEVENSECKLDTYRQSQTPGDDEYKDHEKTRSQNLREHEMSQDLRIGRMSGSAPGGSQKAMTLEDHQKVSEAMIKIQVTEEIIHVGEQDLKAEDAELAICLMTDRNATQHGYNMHIEEVQFTLAEREVKDSDAVSRLVSNNENSNDEVEKQTENQPLVCEELSDEDTYDKAGSGLSFLNSELEMTTRKSSDVSKAFGHKDIIADRSESNEVEEEGTLDDQRKVSETMRKIQVKDEMLSVEQDLEEAKDGEIKLHLMSDLSPADDHNMHIEEVQMTVAETEVEDSDAVSRLVSKNENSNNEVEKQTENQHLVCEELSEEDTYDKAGSGLSFLNSELKVTIRKTSNVSEDCGHVDKVDRSESDEVEEEKTQDDQEKVSETTRKIQEKEEMLSFEKVLEDVDVTLCQMIDLSPSDEHNMQVEEANVQSNVLDTEVQNSDVASQLALENEISNDEVKNQVENQCLEISVNDQGGTGLTSFNEGFKMTIRKSANASEDAEHKYVITSRSESNEIKDERESVSEFEDNQTAYVKQEQEKNVRFFEENNQEFVTKHVECNKEVQQRAEPQMYKPKEKEDVAKDHEVQTKTRETGTVIEKSHMTTEISVEGRVFVKDEWMLSREEEGNNENCVETACGILSGAVKSKGETGQETSSESKNTPLGIYEGKELNSPTCEETQEGVPEYNNKTVPDENTTQWFLEGGDYKEIYATLLPEEVESGEPESLQNSGSGGDFSVVREHEEEQGSTGEEQTRTFQNKTIGLLEETKKLIVEPVEESGQLSEKDEVRLVQNPKTTWTEHSEEVFEIDRTATELQGRNEKLLVDSESDEGVSEIRNAAEDGQESTGAVAVVDSLVRLTDKTLKFLEFEGEEITETSFWQESEAVVSSQYKSIKSPTLDDTAEVGVLKQSDETDSKLPEDTTVEMQAAGTGMEETGSGDEAVANEIQNKSEMERLDVALTTKDNMSAKRETLFDLDSIPHQSVETRNPPPHEVFDILIDTREEDDFLSTRRKPKDLTLILEEEMLKHEKEAEESRAERTHSSVSGCQNFIDEEILDLWIEAASFQDTDVAEEQETGQQMHVTVETLQTEEEKEKLLESIPGKSGLVIDAETYLSTADSGFLDLSVSEWERDLRQTSSGTFQSPSDMLFTDLLTPQPNYESEEETERGHSNMREEELIAKTRFHPDSGHQSSEDGYLHQESNQSQEKKGQEGDIQSSVQKEEVKEKLEALISVESGLVSITETSLSTGESELLYQSVSEWERDLFGSFQGPNDMLFTELSVPKHNSESQEATETGKSAMTEEEAIAEARFHMETRLHQSSEDKCLHQESDQSQEKNDQQGNIWSSMQTEEVKEKLEKLISGESGLVSAMEISSSTAESGLLYHSVSEWGSVHRDISTWSFPGPNDHLETEMSTQEPYFESQEATERGQSAMTEDNSSTEMGFHPDSRIGATEAGHQESDQSQQRQGEEGNESVKSETGSQKVIGTDVTNVAIRTDEEKNKGEDAHLKVTASDSSDEIKLPQSRSDSDASFQDETMLTDSQDDTCTESEEPQANTWSEDTDDSLPKLIRPETAEELASHSEFLTEMNVTVLDFTAQRSRIAVKNRHVRPPQNPRSLLNMPSEDPTPAIHPPVKAPTGVPFGGMGIGIKLPGLGAGFPVLKKTRVVPEDKSSEESETKPEKSESPKPEETQHRPKWMPPSHQGFGNPLMSELKTKLRKATKE